MEKLMDKIIIADAFALFNEAIKKAIIKSTSEKNLRFAYIESFYVTADNRISITWNEYFHPFPKQTHNIILDFSDIIEYKKQVKK